MTNQESEDTHALIQAREVFLHVAHSPVVREEHTRILPYCDDSTLSKIVDLAWRYQFSEDRYPFKRDIRDLQQYVARKAKDQSAGTS